MNRTILYYPTINISNDDWIRNSLLYWDDISSIVPHGGDQFRLNPNLQYLEDEDLYRPIRPEALIFEAEDSQLVRRFENEFIDSLNDPVRQSKQFPTYSKSQLQRPDRPDFYEIHNNKVSKRISEVLNEKGLVVPDSLNEEWILFERDTAIRYMSVLAKYLAEIDRENIVVGTDSRQYENLNFQNSPRKERIPCIGTILNNILPSPAPGTAFETIVDFKRRRRDELLRFRQVISDFEVQISTAEDLQEIKRIMIDFSENLETGVNDINASLKDARISAVARTLKSLVSIKSPILWSTLATYVGRETQVANVPVGVTLAGLGVIGSVELFHGYMHARNEQLALKRNSPFSYLYEARKRRVILQ